MKVICIDGMKIGAPVYNGFGKPINPLKDSEEIHEGEVYTVFDECRNSAGIEYYRLNERPMNICYMKKKFLPLSEIPETTFERNYQTQTV